ncbi:hypothetical protein SDC9_134394 [bioreactor metagenome]|uniref:Uncharacterized protein n=1 Tax=bioreactor metagenome TaxID=1076179 RepID=A0A645DE33_9ZZZZ
MRSAIIFDVDGLNRHLQKRNFVFRECHEHTHLILVSFAGKFEAQICVPHRNAPQPSLGILATDACSCSENQRCDSVSETAANRDALLLEIPYAQHKCLRISAQSAGDFPDVSDRVLSICIRRHKAGALRILVQKKSDARFQGPSFSAIAGMRADIARVCAFQKFENCCIFRTAAIVHHDRVQLLFLQLFNQ